MSEARSPIVVGHAGLGKWGPNLLRNVAQNPRARLAALCDPDRERLAHFAEGHPGIRTYGTIEEMAADEELAAVVLATPAGLHAAHVRLMIEAGKDVLVEKPLALTLTEARDLVRLARDRGRILMVGHTFLFNPAVIGAREAIASGSLGRIHLISAQRLSLGRIRTDCNALWNLAPHDISILLYWMGALPESVSTRGVVFDPRHEQEDFALCVLEFPGRTVATIQVGWLNPVKVRAMTVVGSEAMLVYNDVDRDQPLLRYHPLMERVAETDPEGSFERFRREIRPGREEAIEVEKTEPLAAEIDHFLRCLARREEPRGSGEEALRIMSVLEACQRSLEHGGAKVIPEEVAPG